MKLKEQTVKKSAPVRNKNHSALMIIAGMVILALLAIFLGNRRKKNTL